LSGTFGRAAGSGACSGKSTPTAAWPARGVGGCFLGGDQFWTCCSRPAGLSPTNLRRVGGPLAALERSDRRDGGGGRFAPGSAFGGRVCQVVVTDGRSFAAARLSLAWSLAIGWPLMPGSKRGQAAWWASVFCLDNGRPAGGLLRPGCQLLLPVHPPLVVEALLPLRRPTQSDPGPLRQRRSPGWRPRNRNGALDRNPAGTRNRLAIGAATGPTPPQASAPWPDQRWERNTAELGALGRADESCFGAHAKPSQVDAGLGWLASVLIARLPLLAAG